MYEETKLEKLILEAVDHPFLISLSFVFLTKCKVLFLMPFIQGGELFSLLRKMQRFSEESTKFYIS
jgi:serine/threonine protein kinase